MTRTLFMDMQLACQYAERHAQAGHRVHIIPGDAVGAPITVEVDPLTPEAFALEVKQICKDFSDLRDRPYMGDVYAAIDNLLAHLQEHRP